MFIPLWLFWTFIVPAVASFFAVLSGLLMWAFIAIEEWSWRRKRGPTVGLWDSEDRRGRF